MSNREKFQDLLNKIHDDAVKNNDYEIGFNRLRMNGQAQVFGEGEDGNASELTDFAMTRLMQFAEMPVSYMKKLKEQSPEMLAQQFNMWAQMQKDSQRLLIRNQQRGDQSIIRGVLSDKYTILDNHEVLESLMKVADDIPEFEVISHYYDDNKFHLRVAFPDMAHDFGKSIEGKDDIIRVGLDIQNSEVGYASLAVAPITYRLICTNGMKAWKQDDAVHRFRHVHMTPEELSSLLSGAMKESISSGKDLLKKMEESRKVDIVNPHEYIDEKVVQFGLSKKAGNRIKEAFDIEPENNLFGVVNGFTRGAQKTDNLDGRLHIEKVASQLMYA